MPRILSWFAAPLVCLMATVAVSQDLQLPPMDSSPVKVGNGGSGFPLPFGFAPKTSEESKAQNSAQNIESSFEPMAQPLAEPASTTTLPAHSTANFAPVVTVPTVPDEVALPVSSPTETLVTPVTHEQPIEISDFGSTSSLTQTTDSVRTPIVSRRISSASSTPNRSRTSKSLVTTFSGLCIVLGLFMGIVWLAKRNGAIQSGPQHAPLVEVLGNYRIGPRNEVSVVRFGSKLLALSVSGNGTETLAELDDPQEVAWLTELCGSTNSATVPRRLRQAIDDLAADSRSTRSTFNS